MKDRLRRWGRLAVVDVAPLKEVPGYRWLFAGMLFVQAGRQLTVVAVPWQVFELTGSTLTVGLLGLAQILPLLMVSLVGGALADALNRRRLLFLSQVLLACTASGLLWNSLADAPAVWPLFVLSAINAGISAIDSPARHAMIPALVGPRLLAPAHALNQTLSNVASAAIPALAGLVISTVGLPFNYGLEVGVFVIGAALIHWVPDIRTEGGGRKFGFSSMVEGLRYMKGKRVIQGTLLIDLNAMVFGMPTALFPAIGTTVFAGNAFTVGMLYAAPGVGALTAAITSGWLGSVRRQGRAILIAVVIWGLAIAVFGLTRSIAMALTMLAIAGAADVISAIFRNTILQLATPDPLRGRMASIHTAVTAGGPRLGDLEAGVVAAVTSVRFSVVSGGVACVVGAIAIARWAKEFSRYGYEPNDEDSLGARPHGS